MQLYLGQREQSHHPVFPVMTALCFFFLHVSVLLVCCSALRLSCHMCENLSVMRYTYIHIVENTTLCSRVENHVYISVFFYDITYEIYLKVIFIDVFIFLLSSDKMLCFYWATYVFFFFSALVLKVQFFSSLLDTYQFISVSTFCFTRNIIKTKTLKFENEGLYIYFVVNTIWNELPSGIVNSGTVETQKLSQYNSHFFVFL